MATAGPYHKMISRNLFPSHSNPRELQGATIPAAEGKWLTRQQTGIPSELTQVACVGLATPPRSAPQTPSAPAQWKLCSNCQCHWMLPGTWTNNFRHYLTITHTGLAGYFDPPVKNSGLDESAKEILQLYAQMHPHFVLPTSANIQKESESSNAPWKEPRHCKCVHSATSKYGLSAGQMDSQ